MTYAWTFAKSFLWFLIIVFVSESGAARLKSLIPMPFIYGVLFMVGFSTGLFPADMLLSSNMVAVGVIAYHVLIVHSGTLINIPMLIGNRRDALTCFISVLVLALTVCAGLSFVIGKELAFLASGSVVGGGATCAIASRSVLEKYPALSVFPWLVFMLQGVFSVPIVSWALKRESKHLLEDIRNGRYQKNTSLKVSRKQSISRKQGICDKIPKKYKTTSYYLMIIMMVTVLNNFLHKTILSGFNINANITALVLGVLFGGIGLMDRAPLFKSDTFGLLLLGLMGLMANTISSYEVKDILAFIPALLLVFVVSSIILVACGIIAAKIFTYRPARGIALTMNCMMGFPVNEMLIQNALKGAETEEEKEMLKAEMGSVLGMGTILVSNVLSIVLISIVVNFI